MVLIEKRYFSVFNVFYASLENTFFKWKGVFDCQRGILVVFVVFVSDRNLFTIIEIIYLTQIVFKIENRISYVTF